MNRAVAGLAANNCLFADFSIAQSRPRQQDGLVQLPFEFPFGEHVRPVGGHSDPGLLQVEQLDRFPTLACAKDQPDTSPRRRRVLGDRRAG